MSTTTQHNRYLFIFDSSDADIEKLQQRLDYYRNMMHLKNLKFNPEWHIVYVTPKIPSYSLYSLSMVKMIEEEEHRGAIILRNLGRILDVPLCQQHLLSGNPDLEAYKLAKELGINKVFGHSKLFLSAQKVITWLKGRFKRKPKMVLKPHMLKR